VLWWPDVLQPRRIGGEALGVSNFEIGSVEGRMYVLAANDPAPSPPTARSAL